MIGVPQESILSPIFLNVYYNDFFMFLEDIDVCNLADVTTPFACSLDLDEVFRKLENNGDIFLKWFQDNYMKMNPSKCHLLIEELVLETMLYA